MLTIDQAVQRGLVSVVLDDSGGFSLHGENGYHIHNDSDGVIPSSVNIRKHIPGLWRVRVADNGQLTARVHYDTGAVAHDINITVAGLLDGRIYSAGIFEKQLITSFPPPSPSSTQRSFTKVDGSIDWIPYGQTVPNTVYTDFAWRNISGPGVANLSTRADFFEGDMPGVDVDVSVPHAYAPCNGDGRTIRISKYEVTTNATCFDYAGPVDINSTITVYNEQEITVDVDFSAAIRYHDVGSGSLDDTWKYDIFRSQLATLQAYANDLYSYRNGDNPVDEFGNPIYIDSTMSGITADTVIAGRTARQIEGTEQWKLDEIVSLQSFCMVQSLRQIADAAYVNNTIDNVVNTLRHAVDDFVNLAAATAASIDQVYTQKAFLTHVVQDIETSYSTVTPIESMDVYKLSGDSEYRNYQAMRDVNALTCDAGQLSHESQRRGTYNAVGAYVMSMGEIAGTSSAPSTIDTGIGASLIASPILSVQFAHRSNRILPFTEIFSPTVQGRTAKCILALSQVDLDVYRIDMYARHFGGDDAAVAASISSACNDLAEVARGMGCQGTWDTPGGDFSAIRGWINAATGSIQAALSTIGLSACTMLPLPQQRADSATLLLTSSEYRALTSTDISVHNAAGRAIDIKVDRIDTSSGRPMRESFDPVDRKGVGWSNSRMSLVRHAGVLTGALGVASLGTALVAAGASSGSIANASWNITGEAIMGGFEMSAPTVDVDKFVPFANPKAMVAWVAKCMLTPSEDSKKPKLMLETLPVGCYLFSEQRPTAVTSMANMLATAALASWSLYLRKYKTYTVARSPIVSPFAGLAVPATVGYGLVKYAHNALSDEAVTNAQLVRVLESYLGTPSQYNAFNVGLVASTELSSKAASALNEAFSHPDSDDSWDDVRKQLRAILTSIHRIGKDERSYYL